jgi:hypothetical protein
MRLIDMMSLVDAFGQVFFFYIDLLADRMTVTVGDDIDLGRTYWEFYGCSVIFGIGNRYPGR